MIDQSIAFIWKKIQQTSLQKNIMPGMEKKKSFSNCLTNFSNCVLHVRYRSMEKLKQETTVNLLNVENLSVETSENQYFIGINRPPKEEHNNKTLDLVIKTNIPG